MTEIYEWFDCARGFNDLIDITNTTATYRSNTYAELKYNFTGSIDGFTNDGASGTTVDNESSIRYRLYGNTSGRTGSSYATLYYDKKIYKKISVKLNSLTYGTGSGITGYYNGFGLIIDKNNWVGAGCGDNNTGYIKKCVGGTLSDVGTVALTSFNRSEQTVVLEYLVKTNQLKVTIGSTTDTITIPADFELNDLKWGLFLKITGDWTGTSGITMDDFSLINDFGYYENGDVITKKIIDNISNITKLFITKIGSGGNEVYISTDQSTWGSAISLDSLMGNSTSPLTLYLKFVVKENEKLEGFALTYQ